MTEPSELQPRDKIAGVAIDVVIRIGLLFLVIYFCFFVIAPFLTVIIWGAILAVILYPVQQWLAARFGGRGGLASGLIVFLGLAVTLIPSFMLGTATFESLRFLEAGLTDGSIKIPPPPDGIADWPLIGQQLNAFWELASNNLQAALGEVKPQVAAVVKSMLRASAGMGLAILQFAASIIVAGLLFGPGEALVATLRALECRIVGRRNSHFVDLTSVTVQNVAQGVIGVALLQAILASIGYLAVDFPFGAALSALVLLLSILNLGPTLPVFLSIIYGWSIMDTLPAIIFTIYMIPVGLLDNFMRPIIVARGLPVPIAVMFIGVAGGALTGGLLGLFIGPIVLAVGYQLFSAWIAVSDADANPPETTVTSDD
ncbi:MAG: AI-2E family transporter [Proteobacteria bacterium]|nr:AI-2E family transporter [Pseudomonadota bacterium]